MSKTKSERKQIIEEWQWIYANFPRFKLIADMKNAVEVNHALGVNAGHFKPTNYIDLYTKQAFILYYQSIQEEECGNLSSFNSHFEDLIIITE